MDYKYITQLLERYWQCQTTLEEEQILRAFFSQKDVPASLLPYKDLFCYEAASAAEDVLGEEFDERILSMIEEPAPVKARSITLAQRFMPLFKAAAIVAIILTLGNAAQVPFRQQQEPINMAEDVNNVQKGTSVAMRDSIVGDSAKAKTMADEAVQLIK